MTGQLPHGPGGPLVGRVPPDDSGPRGDHWGTMSVGFCIYRLESLFCIGSLIPILYRVVYTHFLDHSHLHVLCFYAYDVFSMC